jgi:hypothetical protein
MRDYCCSFVERPKIMTNMTFMVIAGHPEIPEFEPAYTKVPTVYPTVAAYFSGTGSCLPFLKRGNLAMSRKS